MYKHILTLIAAGLFLTACAESPSDSENTDAETNEAPATSATSTESAAVEMTDDQKRAYALGANSAGFLTRSFPEFDTWGMSVDREMIKKGFLDTMDVFK